jgi:membrane associated rhomboid family serine protease
VGASGWLFGLLAFGVAYYHRQGRRDLRDFFVQWSVYAFVLGWIIGVNSTAHAGGFAGGLILGLIADLTPARRHALRWVWEALFWPSLLAWIVTVAIMFRSIAQSW